MKVKGYIFSFRTLLSIVKSLTEMSSLVDKRVEKHQYDRAFVPLSKPNCGHRAVTTTRQP